MMNGAHATLGLPEGLPAAAASSPVIAEARLRGMVEAHYDFVWRLFRRLGLSGADADDAVQQVFLVASRRIDTIVETKERGFLVGTALHQVAHVRRARQRNREVASDDAYDERGGAEPAPDELLEQRRARALLDEILAAMPLELRAVFVLFEYEQMSTTEIAPLLGIPVGTAASRLRRARDEFQQRVDRLRARDSLRGGRR